MSDVVARLIDDPPLVHSVRDGGPWKDVVWSTESSCYEFLAAHVRQGTATLETGIGVSTAIFAALGATHVCVTKVEAEVDRLRDYCRKRDLSLANVRFEVGLAEYIVPALALPGLDVVFLDGGHGFPSPVVEWFFAARHLRREGLLVLDDVGLPAVRVLVDFLAADDRWERVAGTEKWLAFRRLGEGDLAEDHWFQPFYTCSEPSLGELARRFAGGLRRRIRRRT